MWGARRVPLVGSKARGRSLHFLNLDKAGIARFTVGVAAGDDDAVALTQGEDVLCDLLGGVEEDVGRGKLLAHRRDNAPGERKSAPGAFIGCKTNNGSGRTVA